MNCHIEMHWNCCYILWFRVVFISFSVKFGRSEWNAILWNCGNMETFAITNYLHSDNMIIVPAKTLCCLLYSIGYCCRFVMKVNRIRSRCTFTTIYAFVEVFSPQASQIITAFAYTIRENTIWTTFWWAYTNHFFF